MDLVSTCKDKLAYFRIKELKDILTKLGLSKQGKKNELVQRIENALSDEQVSKLPVWGKKTSMGKEGVAKIIDDTYRKMQVSGATDLASKAHSGSSLNDVKLKEEVDDAQYDMKIRCPCGSSLFTDSMIMCDDMHCQVWQHIGCVIIPEKPMEGVSPEVPPQFYCEYCRINRADPFWLTLAHPLPPVKLIASNLVMADGTNAIQNVEKTFHLTRADRDLLQRPEYDLQAWCILLNDKVPFRMQWPQFADLLVNGVPFRTINRPGSQLLGINGRDDGPIITTCSREGSNKISLSRCDTRIFCFGVRIVKRRSVQEVLNLVPKEPDGELFEDALARVCRCIGGGTAAENADSDSDLEVVADSVTVNIRCPMSGSRIKVAGRFKPCVHMGGFDLETFVELNQRSRKWQCPICLKNYSLENIIIDPYFNRITSLMQDCGEDVNEIDVKPDGCWRAKSESRCRDLERWHFPDGSLCVVVEQNSNLEILKQIKQEGTSEGHTSLKLGIKRNQNGLWEVSRPEEVHPLSSGSNLAEKFEKHCSKIMPMSSSASGSYRDGDDPSVNQVGGGHFDFSTNNGNDLDSLSLNFDSTYSASNRIPSAAPLRDLDVIVLSDSEEENADLISPESLYHSGPADGTGIPFHIPPPGVSEPYPVERGLDTGLGTGLALFNSNGDDFGIPLWQTGPAFRLFGTDADVSDTLIDEEHTAVACTAPVNGYGLAPDTAIESASQVQDPLICHPSTEINSDLVDNPLAFGGDDPSLQIFLPARPPGDSVQNDPNLTDRPDMSNENWISLSLGGGVSQSDSAAMKHSDSRNQCVSKVARTESLANTASLLPNRNDDRSDKGNSNKRRSDGPFSYPRQPRSVRHRRLSLDTDSD